MASLILPEGSMLSLITNRATQKPITALSSLTEYQLGYNAYGMGKGPGMGLLRTAGWLQAWRDECAELRQRADDRGEAEYHWQY